jgi:hypothetical protein
MSTLISAPFSLTFDSLVAVRVKAINSNGAGTASTVNTSGAKIRTVPNALAAPVSGSATDAT